ASPYLAPLSLPDALPILSRGPAVTGPISESSVDPPLLSAGLHSRRGSLPGPHIWSRGTEEPPGRVPEVDFRSPPPLHLSDTPGTDRKSTRLNSSHVKISY